MGLPKIQQPLFELTVPSTGQKVNFRPFTVKEEKILLIAQESEDINQIILAIKQIINNCVEGIHIEDLAIFDIEYILIKLRSVSVGNEISFAFRDEETDELVKLTVDTDDIELVKNKDHNTIIGIDDDVSIVMGYPKIDNIKITTEDLTEKDLAEKTFDVMMSCIKSVVNGDQVLELKDFSEQEINDFIESLSTKTMTDIKKFFETIPVVRVEKKYKLENGKEKTLVMEGTEAFFT